MVLSSKFLFKRAHLFMIPFSLMILIFNKNIKYSSKVKHIFLYTKLNLSTLPDIII